MSEEIIIGSLLTKIMRYSKKYEISVQFWPDQWAIFINKDGIELTSFGGEPENTLRRGVEYLDRINRVSAKV
jgi:hypothetical protein